MSDNKHDLPAPDSPEEIAYKLFKQICSAEKPKSIGRKWILDTYSECLMTVRNPQARSK